MRKHIIYLASGSSRRFGGNKLLHALAGKPLYRHGLDTLVSVLREDCTLTVVSRYPEIREAAEKLGLWAVDCPDSEQGISHSIRAGILSLGEVPQEDYLVFAVADQPYLRADSVLRLLELAQNGAECGALCYGQQPGNPTLFSARLMPELLALEGDTGGRAVLRKHDCRFIPAGSPKELDDIDFRK